MTLEDENEHDRSSSAGDADNWTSNRWRWHDENALGPWLRTPYGRWAMFGAASALGSFLALVLAIAPDFEVAHLTSSHFVGIFVWGTIFASLGLLGGMALRALRDFVVNVFVALRPPGTTIAEAREPFDDRFSRRDENLELGDEDGRRAK